MDGRVSWSGVGGLGGYGFVVRGEGMGAVCGWGEVRDGEGGLGWEMRDGTWDHCGL